MTTWRSTLAWVRRTMHAVLRPRRDADLVEELRAHLAMHVDENLRAGMQPAEARRMAHARLGGVEQIKERVRDTHPLQPIGTLWLDVKLGLRMLRKYWGLTLVGGLAMTLAIGIGAVGFAVFDTFFRGTVPLDEGDRVVAIQTWDDLGYRRADTAWADIERWRDTLRSVEDLGAYQTRRRAFVTDEGVSTVLDVAEMTASGFRLARVAPALGRTLLTSDEAAGAAPVVVIGDALWERWFESDPTVVGQSVRLGGIAHAIVGVMPEGFGFPFNHQLWVPLRLSDGRLGDAGPEGVVFARLTPGVSLPQAQAELAALGLVGPAPPDTELRPRAVPYTFAFTGDFERSDVRLMVGLALVAVALLLVPPCVNIAILVYARTVARQEEFAARFALGASRGRIVVQLFIETLVLAAGASVLALVAANVALEAVGRDLLSDLPGGPPFWMTFPLSPATFLVVGGLALVAATIAGLAPALKATAGQLQLGLRALGDRIRAAETLPGSRSRLAPTQPCLHPEVLFLGEMERELVLDLRIGGPPPAQHAETSPQGTKHGVLFGRSKHPLHRVCQPVPLGVLGRQPASARPGEPVVLGPFALVREGPVGLHPTLCFETVQRGVQRAGLDLEDIVGRRPDVTGDGVAMGATKAQRAENQEVERALEQLDPVGGGHHVDTLRNIS